VKLEAAGTVNGRLITWCDSFAAILKAWQPDLSQTPNQVNFAAEVVILILERENGVVVAQGMTLRQTRSLALENFSLVWGN
jgi:hypothetical protein